MANAKRNKIIRNITIIIAITFLISIISRSLTATIIIGAGLVTMILVYINCINERLYFEWKHILSIAVIFVGMIVSLNGLILCVKAHNAIDINELKSDNIKSGTYVKGNLTHLYTREMNDGTKEVENNGFSGSVTGYDIVYIWTKDDKLMQLYMDERRYDRNEEAINNIINGLSDDIRVLKFTGVIKNINSNKAFVKPKKDKDGNYIGSVIRKEDSSSFIESYVIQEYNYMNYKKRLFGGLITISSGLILFMAFGGKRSVIIPERKAPEEIEYDGSIYDRWVE